MLKGLLLFLAGLLLGANVVYFLMTPQATPERAHAAATPAADAQAAAAAPESVRPASLPAETESRSAAPPAHAPNTPPGSTSARNAAGATAPPPGPPAGALLVPVVGVRADQLSDTYHQTRGGSRIHEALDIMAPRGTPVVAAADGQVEKLFTSKAGGLTVYQFDPTRTRAYYYAHLDRYAPDLHEGRQLRRGDPIGSVGSTGNASEDAPHLHFAIFLLGPEKRWWEGTPVNPYPLLRTE